MKNFSTNKEAINLKSGTKYIVIDALYINDIRQELSNIREKFKIDEIRSKVFPYTNTPFAKYTPLMDTFTLPQIRKVDFARIDDEEKSVLSTDSGVLIFIAENVFSDFVSKFDYYELVNSEIDLLNTDYWRTMVKNYNMTDVALVVAPGIGSGVDFEGSGTYRIE
jgi:hypothetical protein